MGTVGGLSSGQSFGQALATGASGAGNGAAVGFVTGAITGYRNAVDMDRNPFTGVPNSSAQINSLPTSDPREMPLQSEAATLVGTGEFQLSPWDVKVTYNEPATINGVDFSGHAFDQMQNRGILSPTVVIDAVENPIMTVPSARDPTVTIYYGASVNVVVSNQTGKIISVYPNGK